MTGVRLNDVHAGLLGDDQAARAARAVASARRRTAEREARRAAGTGAVSGTAVGAVLWFVGADPVHAVLAGLGVLGLVLVGSAFDPRPDERWSREPLPDGHGARTELAHLSWTMRGRDGRVGERVVQRLRRTATSRLARVGLRLDEPEDAARAAELLGPRAWSTLHPTGGRMPRLADVEHTVARLEGLLRGGPGSARGGPGASVVGHDVARPTTPPDPTPPDPLAPHHP